MHILQLCEVLIYLVCFRKSEANKAGGLASLSDAPPLKSGLSSLTGAPSLKEPDSKFSHVCVLMNVGDISCKVINEVHVQMQM